MVQRQETSVLKAQSSGHMDTGETKAEPAVLNLAVLHGQVRACAVVNLAVLHGQVRACAVAFAVLDKLPGHSLWEDEPEQLCTWAEKWNMESQVSGWASSDVCEVSLPFP